MLVIAVALIFFELGKSHPTLSFKKTPRPVQLASPVFPVPQLRRMPRASRERPVAAVKKSKAKAKSKSQLAKKFRKQRRAISSTVGTPPKLVKE